MPNINETQELARRILPLIYVLDTSGSMKGERVAAVNEAMKEAMELLKEISAKNSDAEIKVGVLKFSSGAEWVTDGLETIENFIWEDLKAGGVTDLGAALKELNSRLSRSQFLVSKTSFYLPVYIFMSDGQPTDNYEEELKKILAENKWFYRSTRLGVAIGDRSDRDVLAKITGTRETVVSVNDVGILKHIIKHATVRTLRIATISRPAVAGSDAVEIIKQMRNEMGEAGNGIVFGESVQVDTTVEPNLDTSVDISDDWGDLEYPWD